MTQNMKHKNSVKPWKQRVLLRFVARNVPESLSKSVKLTMEKNCFFQQHFPCMSPSSMFLLPYFTCLFPFCPSLLCVALVWMFQVCAVLVWVALCLAWFIPVYSVAPNSELHKLTWSYCTRIPMLVLDSFWGDTSHLADFGTWDGRLQSNCLWHVNHVTYLHDRCEINCANAITW